MKDGHGAEANLLQVIARRLGRRDDAGSRSAEARAVWYPSLSLPDRPPAVSCDTLASRFLAELNRLGGHGIRVASLSEAVEYVRRVAAGGPLVMWDDPLLTGLGLPEALARDGLEVTVWDPNMGRGAAKALAASSRTGITGATWGVAETGTIVLPTGPRQGRLVSLLPPVHVALLPEDRLLPSIAELFRTLATEARSGAALPSSLALATGPSRSADIENDLTIGVHGPVEVHVVLLGALG